MFNFIIHGIIRLIASFNVNLFILASISYLGEFILLVSLLLDSNLKSIQFGLLPILISLIIIYFNPRKFLI